MFFISLFILFFAVVFAFDRFIFRENSENFKRIATLFRLHRASNTFRDRKIEMLERRLDELEEKFGKITTSHHSRIEKMENFSLDSKKDWEKFTKFDDIPNIHR